MKCIVKLRNVFFPFLSLSIDWYLNWIPSHRHQMATANTHILLESVSLNEAGEIAEQPQRKREKKNRCSVYHDFCIHFYFPLSNKEHARWTKGDDDKYEEDEKNWIRTLIFFFIFCRPNERENFSYYCVYCVASISVFPFSDSAFKPHFWVLCIMLSLTKREASEKKKRLWSDFWSILKSSQNIISTCVDLWFQCLSDVGIPTKADATQHKTPSFVALLFVSPRSRFCEPSFSLVLT